MTSFAFTVSIFAIIIVFWHRYMFIKLGSSLDIHSCLANEVQKAYIEKSQLIFDISFIALILVAISAYYFRERTEITEVLPYLLLPALALNFVSLHKKINAFFDKMQWAFCIERQSRIRWEAIVEIHMLSSTVAMITSAKEGEGTDQRIYRVDCQRVGLAMSEITGFLMKSVVIFYEDSTQLNEIPVAFIAPA